MEENLPYYHTYRLVDFDSVNKEYPLDLSDLNPKEVLSKSMEYIRKNHILAATIVTELHIRECERVDIIDYYDIRINDKY